MRSESACLLFVGLTLGSACGQDATQPPWAAVRDEILPSAEELRWQSIPWRDTLSAAALEADDRESPVLLWVMNGHPLGCT